MNACASCRAVQIACRHQRRQVARPEACSLLFVIAKLPRLNCKIRAASNYFTRVFVHNGVFYCDARDRKVQNPVEEICGFLHFLHSPRLGVQPPYAAVAEVSAGWVCYQQVPMNVAAANYMFKAVLNVQPRLLCRQ